MGIKKYFERRRLLKQEKAELIDTINELSRRLNNKLNDAISQIEELRQDKLYYISLDDATQEDTIELKQYLGLIKRSMKWTIPNIFLTTCKIEELTSPELKELLKRKKELSGGVK